MDVGDEYGQRDEDEAHTADQYEWDAHGAYVLGVRRWAADVICRYARVERFDAQSRVSLHGGVMWQNYNFNYKMNYYELL